MATALAVPGHIREPNDIARHIFLEDPGLSIDEVARALANAGKGISKEVISRIRSEVRQSIQTAGTKEKFVRPMVRHRGSDVFTRLPQVQVINPVGKPPPFNPPRLADLGPGPKDMDMQPPPAAKPEPALPVFQRAAAAATPAHMRAESPSLEEKRKWLDDWLLENPRSSVAKARDALKSKFGVTMSTTYIAEQVRVAHELVSGRQIERQSVPSGADLVVDGAPVESKHVSSTARPVYLGAQGIKIVDVADLAQAMKSLGIRRIELRNNAYIVDFDE